MAPRNNDQELKEQTWLMDWARMQKLPIGLTVEDLCFAFKNESYEHSASGKPWQAGQRINRYKRAGMKPGTPDLLFAYPCYGQHGLFIEMKAMGGSVRENQIEMHIRLRAAGYIVAVCYGWEQAKDTICAYLDGEYK